MCLGTATSDPSIPAPGGGLFPANLPRGNLSPAGIDSNPPRRITPRARDCPPAPASGSRPPPLPDQACGEAGRAGGRGSGGSGSGRAGKGARGRVGCLGPPPRRGPERLLHLPRRAALTRQLVVGAVQVAGVGQALLPAFAPHLPAPPSGGGNRDGAHGLRRRAGGARARRLPPPRRPRHSPRQQEGAGGAGELGSVRLGTAGRSAQPPRSPPPPGLGTAAPSLPSFPASSREPPARPRRPAPRRRGETEARPGAGGGCPGGRWGELRGRGREGAAPGCTEVGVSGGMGEPWGTGTTKGWRRGW